MVHPVLFIDLHGVLVNTPRIFSEYKRITVDHLLEHFNRFEAIDILEQWKVWLKKGGKLVIEVPDFEQVCKDFSGGNKYWLSRHTFGSHKANWAFHKESWWEEKFEEVLTKLGFEIIEFKKEKRVYPINLAYEDTTLDKDFQGIKCRATIFNKFRKFGLSLVGTRPQDFSPSFQEPWPFRTTIRFGRNYFGV